jgi:hypothetical protein
MSLDVVDWTVVFLATGKGNYDFGAKVEDSPAAEIAPEAPVPA